MKNQKMHMHNTRVKKNCYIFSSVMQKSINFLPFVFDIKSEHYFINIQKNALIFFFRSLCVGPLLLFNKEVREIRLKNDYLYAIKKHELRNAIVSYIYM